jgi:hypothetical protein
MFFSDAQNLPNGITNEPLSEWPMNEILDYTPYAAEADVYGKMVAYVREMLVEFQLRLKKKGILVQLACAGTAKMTGHFMRHFRRAPEFDRIEVKYKAHGGNIAILILYRLDTSSTLTRRSVSCRSLLSFGTKTRIRLLPC